jgi:hypothetical protein
LIAAGISSEGYTNTSEIIDLEQSSDLWNEVKQLPTMVDTPMAGLLNQRTPIMCGISECLIYRKTRLLQARFNKLPIAKKYFFKFFSPKSMVTTLSFPAITNSGYNEQIWLVPSLFVVTEFGCYS